MSFKNAFTQQEQETILESALTNLQLRRPDAERYLLARERPLRRNPLLDAQWVRRTHLVCEALRNGEAKPLGLFSTIFWISLYGVLVDLRRRFRKDAELHDYATAQGKKHPFLDASAAVFEACNAVRSSLNEDELIYATFLRHIHAHVYQDSFEYEIEPGNVDQNQPSAVRTKQTVPAVARHVDVDEAHRILDEVSARYGHDDGRIAVNFAHKVGPAVERLAEAMQLLVVERERDNQLPAAKGPSGAG